MNRNTLDTGQGSTGQQLIHNEIETVANAATGLHRAVRSLSKKSDHHHHRHAGSKGHRLRAGSDATFVVASRDDEGDVEMTGPDGNTSSTSGSFDKDKVPCVRIRPVRTDTEGSADSSARDSVPATTTGSTGSNSRTSITVPTATSTSTKKSAHTGFTVTTTSVRSKGSSRKSKSSKSSKSSDSAANPQPRVVYGPGAITQLPTELKRLQLKAPVIVSSPSRIPLGRKIQSLISDLDSRILDSAVVNVPTRVIDDAVARISNRDCVISVGGDSAVGLAKAIGQRKQIPHICIPTTYSGAEPALLGGGPGHSGKLLKYSNREVKGTITVVIYDEDLTMSSPTRFSAPSGILEDVEDGKRKNGKDEDAQWSYLHLPGV